MGKFAQKNGTAKVKTYGAMLVKDHTAANKQVKALAKKKGIAKIPAEVPLTDIEKKEHNGSPATTRRSQRPTSRSRPYATRISRSSSRP